MFMFDYRSLLKMCGPQTCVIFFFFYEFICKEIISTKTARVAVIIGHDIQQILLFSLWACQLPPGQIRNLTISEDKELLTFYVCFLLTLNFSLFLTMCVSIEGLNGNMCWFVLLFVH